MKKKDFDHIDKLAQDAFEHFEVPFDAGEWMNFQQQLNKESTIDQVAKDALQAYEVPLDPNGWEEFEKIQHRKKGGLLYIWWYKAAEVGIMTLLLLGTLFNLPCSHKKSIHNNSFAYGSTNTLITTSNNNNTNTLTGSVSTTDESARTTPTTAAAQELEEHTTISPLSAPPSNTKELEENKAATSTNIKATKTINDSRSTSKSTKQNQSAAYGVLEPNVINALSTTNIAAASTTNGTAITANDKAAMTPNTDYSNRDITTKNKNTINASKSTNTATANNSISANSNNKAILNKSGINTNSINTQVTSSSSLLKQLQAINSSTLQLAVPNTSNKTIEPITPLKPIELKAPHVCRHYLGATLGVGANMGTSMGKTSIGYTGGLTYEKEFSSKISLTVGLSSSYKRYDRSDLIQLDRSTIDGKIYEITQIKTSNLFLVEIPLEVNYTCFRSDKWRIYANVGISANAIFSRTYTGSQQLQVDGLSISTELNSNDFERGLVEGGAAQQNLYLSVGAGVGVERKLDDNLSLYLLPTYRHGINSVHNDLIHTFNVNIGIKKALGK